MFHCDLDHRSTNVQSEAGWAQLTGVISVIKSEKLIQTAVCFYNGF